MSAGRTMLGYETRLSTRSGRIWVSFTAGIVLWFLGELSWAYYTIGLQIQIPYPSAADAFYLAGYFPLMLGLFLYVAYFRSAISTSKMIVVALAILGSAAAIVYALLGPIFAASEPALTFFFDLAYPLLDLVLLSLAILGLGLLVRGRLGNAWALLTTGVLLNVLGDLLFSYTTASGTYYNGSISDFIYLWGYLAFALAFYVHHKEL
ncbi:MAG TPA: hypothetical protein VFE91_06155 [Nitrososphaerales archaeon]|nr:hypothetical protein [Nitrososphaerales archaeon]